MFASVKQQLFLSNNNEGYIYFPVSFQISFFVPFRNCLLASFWRFCLLTFRPNDIDCCGKCVSIMSNAILIYSISNVAISTAHNFNILRRRFRKNKVL